MNTIKSSRLGVLFTLTAIATATSACSAGPVEDVGTDEAAAVAAPQPPPAPPQCAMPQSVNPCWGLRLGDVCGNGHSMNKLICQSVGAPGPNGPRPIPAGNGAVVCNVCALPNAAPPGGPAPLPPKVPMESEAAFFSGDEAK